MNIKRRDTHFILLLILGTTTISYVQTLHTNACQYEFTAEKHDEADHAEPPPAKEIEAFKRPTSLKLTNRNAHCTVYSFSSTSY